MGGIKIFGRMNRSLYIKSFPKFPPFPWVYLIIIIFKEDVKQLPISPSKTIARGNA